MRPLDHRDPDHYDVVVVGSGFGGSVAALRLTEKGYRVCVLEAGRRWADGDFAETSWNLRRFLWAPKLGLTGIQRVHVLRHVVVLAGAGVGGGSLNYANTLYVPESDAFYRDPQWAGITDWRAELAPHYDQASRMLGVVQNPTLTPSDEVMREVAAELGVADTFRPAPVGVFFGREGRREPGVEVDDPFFGGAGPRRRGCTEIGACLTGCRLNAKNTLVKNYLYLAERAGAEVRPLRTVTAVVPDQSQGQGRGWRVESVRTGAWMAGRTRETVTADHVVLAAGAWGTQQLLHRLKADGRLPDLSDRLGVLTRTNSESLGGATALWRHRNRRDYSRGVAITSSFHPNPTTHVEPVRYAKGSNAMGLLATLATRGDGRAPRWLRWIGTALRHPGRLASLYLGLGRWSERTVIALVMQSHDNSLTLYPKRRFGRVRVTSEQGHGRPNPTWIPEAHEVLERMSGHVGGFPGNSIGEIVDVPMTAHFLGGCVIGESAATGVVDAYHRVFGYPGLHILDGSTVSANPGVNPALTITAQAERATALWPNRGGPDPRPALGASYRRVVPVPPDNPAVPAGAPGELRLPTG